ncbi:MAG: 2-oxoglutarate dehydrogenase E1 component [Syntrophobacteraceae bacterium]|nr:2-oxoglutarate dehydrogenase E1 component [Syntrophobacteraceae bacterium]
MVLAVAQNVELIDSLYQQWKSDPEGSPREWRAFFEGFEFAASSATGMGGVCSREDMLRQARVESLIARHRELGHLLACLDPLETCVLEHPLLSLESFGLGDEDLGHLFHVPSLAGAGEQATLREIVDLLRDTYCHSVGVEYMHLQDPGEKRWLQERMEPARNRSRFSADEKRRILRLLSEAMQFDQFLHNKYLSQKRFSVQGAESMVPLLDGLVRHAAVDGCREVILGMSHRGRLNVQVNNLGKPMEAVFCEFEDSYDPESLVGSGDVKYHKGYLSDVTTPEGHPVRLLLVTNPSHLEAVDPVVEGIARARQERWDDRDTRRVLPVLMHGDAAFAGQGIVAETLNLSQLEGYRTGGTIHVVVNNQIGFTTLPEDARSTRYSTDIAKMLMVPIFHVHGEDPEAVLHVARLAWDYRVRFRKDVVIDLVCYRRYGHNEGDEPYFTQPRMYERIRHRPPVPELYGKVLVGEGVVTEGEVESARKDYLRNLEEAYKAAHEHTCPAPVHGFYESWEGFGESHSPASVESGVDGERLIQLARQCVEVPDGFSVHPKLSRILGRRLESVEAGGPLDWATGEMLAFASLLAEGTAVRLSGQDSRRGTFSQRHTSLFDVKTGESFVPLDHLGEGAAPFFVYDSMLSESAVMGFEYGYALVSPQTLVLWEAQFGDFANNAQGIIDQFISSGEAKWQRLNGLTLLLPHGLEGQGPEHSSARLERFLQLCAGNNMQVCYPTTPAQYFHLLRRQVKQPFRKPLIVMAPKSLLRHPRAVSSVQELSAGGFHEVLRDEAPVESPRRVLLCSGKIHYDLAEKRESTGSYGHVILRLEQLYPRPDGALRQAVEPFREVKEWLWVQEEPQNMGAWSFVREWLQELTGRKIVYVGRKASPSPATGYHGVHKLEQQEILERAFDPGATRRKKSYWS